MKKIYVPVIVFTCLALLVSCKKDGFLGRTVTNNLDETVVFTDSSNTVAFLSGIYANIGVSYKPVRFGNGALDVASDEAEVSSTSSSTASQFATGTVNAASVSNDVYVTCYSSIRAVNILFKNLSEKSKIGEVRRTSMLAEARFLRAWYYSILLKHYGGVPIIGDTVYAYTDRIPAPRSTYAQTVDYILDECKTAMEQLPYVRTGLEYGRITKGACLALRARVLLYAASPAYNDESGGGSGEETALSRAKKSRLDAVELVAYKNYDVNRWQLAADEAKKVIEMGIYMLHANVTRPGLGFQEVFRMRKNEEYILTEMRPNNADLEDPFMVPSRGGNRSGGFPYQELVDAFPMRNGLPITDPASGYNEQNPYANRDPRLDFSVIHDQTRVAIRQFPPPNPALSPINLFANNVSPTGDEVRRGTPTGYYRYKMLDSLVPGTYSIVNTTQRCFPMIRLAEIYLNYAEASNEVGEKNEAYRYLDSVRKRAGILPGADNFYGIKRDLTKEQLRVVIQNERRIELAFEEHRFWDVRRWKIANAASSKMMTGMEVTRAGGVRAGAPTYKRFNVSKHDFRAAMYLWPFPQSETGKSPELIQNPDYL